MMNSKIFLVVLFLAGLGACSNSSPRYEVENGKNNCGNYDLVRLERISDEQLLYRKLINLGVSPPAEKLLKSLADGNAEIGRDLAILADPVLASKYSRIPRSELPTVEMLLHQCEMSTCKKEVVRFLSVGVNSNR